jgi:serine/threonine protein kinase
MSLSDIKNNNKYISEKINMKEYEIGMKIGKINFGIVAFCKKISTKKLFSLKIYKKAVIIHNKFAEYIYNEYTNLMQIYHPFITEFNGIYTKDPKYLFLLFEYILGEPLKYYLKKNKKFPLEDARFYIASLVTVFDYLHKKNIIYRGLKLDNILLNSNGYIKLSDFTFSKKFKTYSDYTYSLVGNIEYYSPEMINQTGYNISVDFWQLGILLYEMLVGNTPFADSDPMKLYQKIKKGKIIFPKDINKSAKFIIKHFLIVDVKKRLGCTKKGILEIVQEPFFQDFDWEKLLHRTLEPPFIPQVNRANFIFNSKYFEESNVFEENDVAIPKEKDIFYNW